MTTNAIVWHNGQLKPWNEATVHVSTHALHYGSSVFEGERVYATPNGPQFFRLRDHTRRLQASARVYGIDIGYDADAIDEACRAVVRANAMQSAYVRPIAFRGAAGLGVLPSDDKAVDFAVLALPWGSYHGDAREHGADVCVSSWSRAAPNTTPTWAKAGGNYLNSQLIALEARRNGYAEGIAMGADGLLSEGAGENLFVVLNGVLVTPPTSASVLVGITRDSILTLAAELGIPTAERTLPREALLYADEVFMCGTAAEITPIRSVDRTPVGAGGVGPLTRALQDAFFGLFDGRTQDRWNWLTPLDKPESQEERALGEKCGHGWPLLDSRGQGSTAQTAQKCGHGWPLLDSCDQGRAHKQTQRAPAIHESTHEVPLKSATDLETGEEHPEPKSKATA